MERIKDLRIYKGVSIVVDMVNGFVKGISDKNHKEIL